MSNLNSSENNRKKALSSKSTNIQVLLETRFSLANEWLKSGSNVLEVGSGIGLSELHLQHVNVTMTDVEWNPWLSAVITSEEIPFAEESFDAIICFEVLHHLQQPAKAIAEFSRILRPGGLIIFHEPHASFLLRLLIDITDHEYIDDAVDVYGPHSCQRGENNWDGNNVIPDLIFNDTEKFSKHFPDLEIVKNQFCECLLFANSGGINTKTPYIPLPRFLLNAVKLFDQFLSWVAPNIFSLARDVIVRKS